VNQVIYLSPHLDDAILSCGGQIAQATDPVQVTTVFAGDPLGDLSPFAASLHCRWELDYDAPAARRAEDRAALLLVRAEPLHWELPECVYRRGPDGAYLYPDEDSLWGALHPADEPLVAELARRIAALPGDALYVPLGAGGHVDHRIVRRAAEESGRPLAGYFEEYPYAEKPAAVQAALEERPHRSPRPVRSVAWQAERVFLDEDALAVKIAAVGRYRSQQSTFWVDEAEMAQRIRAYALQVGDGRPAERRWRRSVK
jgi:LmbE family N-acetylglucosaminyl deacetylase